MSEVFNIIFQFPEQKLTLMHLKRSFQKLNYEIDLIFIKSQLVNCHMILCSWKMLNVLLKASYMQLQEYWFFGACFYEHSQGIGQHLTFSYSTCIFYTKDLLSKANRPAKRHEKLTVIKFCIITVISFYEF